MSPNARLITAVAIVCALLVALSLYLKSWGGVALVMVAAAGFAWYRIQVMRGEEAAERFFADAGEDTRLTGFQHASPSEMPSDRPAASPPGATAAPPADLR